MNEARRAYACMRELLPHNDRRAFLSRIALGMGASAFLVRGAYADELTRTPAQTEGPFYPNKLPLDTDNDLIIINEGMTPAAGEVTYLTGRILGPSGEPVRGALVEIWQCDQHGKYLHTGDTNSVEPDKNFQGFGRFLTGSTGEYLFRTIKPVPYPGRTPHIHFKIKRGGKELLTTQCYVKGHPGNARDGIYRSVRDTKALESITVAFEPLTGAKAGELTARFDVVLGTTPEA